MRKEKEVAIDNQGSRDHTKIYLITELPAAAGEDWAMRALRLAQRSGADIPGGVQAGMAGIAAIGILTVLEGSSNIDELRPLLADMMRCVKIITDKKTRHARPIDDASDDIEEIGTRIVLRKEWLNLHLDFSIADALSTFVSKTTSAETSS